MQTAAMRNLITLLVSLLISLSFAQQDNPDATLLQGLAGNEDFSSLVRLLEQAGLTGELEGAGPFTLFAPSNAVLEELNPDILEQLNDDPELLKSVLQSHVVQGAYGIKELRDAEAGSVVTLNGEPLEIDLTAGGLTVDGADLVSTDVDNTYSNGVLNEVGDLVLSASLRSQLGISDTEEATSDVATGGPASLTFADLDTDADGVLSQDELDAGLYTGYDADRDGIIDQTEYDANPGLFGGAFADFDADASGGLNEEEYRGAFADGSLFNQLDADGSGDVSQTEFDANRDLLGLGAAVTGATAETGGAETGGAETGGAIEAEAETGGAETGGAVVGTETGGAVGTETGGTMTGDETGGAETGGAETGGAPTDTEENADALFDQLDTDGSGDISREEFDANRDLLGLGAVGTTGAAVVGAEIRGTGSGAETGGAETGGAETGGTETGGAETGGAETGALSPAQTATPTAAQQALPDTANVRVTHLSPNAPAVDISLTSTLEGGETLAPEALTGLNYEASTDYLEVPVGDYTVSVTSEGNPVLEEEVNFAPGVSYTVAALGLVLPGEDAEAEEEGGFVGFIQNLFSGGREPDALSLRLLVLEDTLVSPMVEGDTLVRLVHAAPGTDAVDLTVTNPEDATARQNVVDNVAFGEASGYTSLAEGFSEPAVTIAGSEAVAFDLADTAFERGTVNTLFVTGTALEQAPLKVIAFSDAPQFDPAAALVAPATGLMGATDPLQQTVGDLVLTDPNLATLALALDQAGMLEALRGPGPFTLFAPSDEAFAALPQEQLDALLANPEALTQVLNNHVVQNNALSADLVGAGVITTLDGTDLAVTAAEDGGVSVGDAAVVVSDVQANNGVIHVIDTVLLPEGLELTP